MFSAQAKKEQKQACPRLLEEWNTPAAIYNIFEQKPDFNFRSQLHVMCGFLLIL